jgi:hypothetical protein
MCVQQPFLYDSGQRARDDDCRPGAAPEKGACGAKDGNQKDRWIEQLCEKKRGNHRELRHYGAPQRCEYCLTQKRSGKSTRPFDYNQCDPALFGAVALHYGECGQGTDLYVTGTFDDEPVGPKNGAAEEPVLDRAIELAGA